MKILTTTLRLLPLLLAGGCVRFEPRPIAPAETAARFEQHALDNPALRTFLETNLHRELTTWPLTEWNLETLTLAAFYYHPSLEIARTQWGVAKAGEITARQRPNPTLGFTPEYNSTAQGVSPWILGGSLDIPIETAGKRGKRLTRAQCLSEAARLRIIARAWEIRSRVRRALLTAQIASESQAILQRQDSLQTETAALVAAQLQSGEVSQFEATQARLAALQTRLALRDAEQQAAVARAQLAEAVGVPASALEEIAFRFEDLAQFPAAPPDAQSRRRAVTSRADLLAMLAEYAASEADLRLEIARQYPDVHLNPGYKLDQTDNKWSLGLTVDLPVLNQNQGPIAQAEARRRETAARFNALQAQVFAEIDQAATIYRGSLAKAADADVLNRDAARQATAAQTMLSAGEISRLDATRRQLELNAAALARLNALAQAQHALGALEDALQGAPPLAEAGLTNLAPVHATPLEKPTE